MLVADACLARGFSAYGKRDRESRLFLNLTSENAFHTRHSLSPYSAWGKLGWGLPGSSGEQSWGHTPAWRMGVPPHGVCFLSRLFSSPKGERFRSPIKRGAGWSLSIGAQLFEVKKSVLMEMKGMLKGLDGGAALRSQVHLLKMPACFWTAALLLPTVVFPLR